MNLQDRQNRFVLQFLSSMQEEVWLVTRESGNQEERLNDYLLRLCPVYPFRMYKDDIE